MLPAWPWQLPVEPRASECPFTALTNCSGNPGSFGACAASGEGGGPGGCPPGITRPTAVPTAGADAWPCAWKPGSHDERLGRVSAKSLKSSMGTSRYRPPWQGCSTGREGAGVSLFGHGLTHPSPGSPRVLRANSIPSILQIVQSNLFFSPRVIFFKPKSDHAFALLPWLPTSLRAKPNPSG